MPENDMCILKGPHVKPWTWQSYKRLLETARRAGYRICGVAEFMRSRPTRAIILRHDIDRKPGNSLRTAMIEKDMDIASTYYVRTKFIDSDFAIISNIHALGHEIGYHYETIDTMNGNLSLGCKKFEYDIAGFQRVFGCQTVAFHGNPLSKYHNKDIWTDSFAPAQFQVSEAQLSFPIEDFLYVTDASGDWSGKTSVKDKPTQKARCGVESFDRLLAVIRVAKENIIYINIHPERWGKSWLFERCRDLLAQTVKRLW